VKGAPQCARGFCRPPAFVSILSLFTLTPTPDLCQSCLCNMSLVSLMLNNPVRALACARKLLVNEEHCQPRTRYQYPPPVPSSLPKFSRAVSTHARSTPSLVSCPRTCEISLLPARSSDEDKGLMTSLSGNDASRLAGTWRECTLQRL
jgi:hypothetical protein